MSLQYVGLTANEVLDFSHRDPLSRKAFGDQSGRVCNVFIVGKDAKERGLARDLPARFPMK
jgi:hypothetical protein